MWNGHPKSVEVINRRIYESPCIDCGNIAFLCIDGNLFCELCGKKGKPYEPEQKID